MQQDRFASLRETLDTASAMLPMVLTAAALVLAGWLIGRLVSWAARRGIAAIVTRLAKQPALAGAMESSGAATQLPRVVGAFTFWVVFVLFLAAAMETLGLPVVTASLSRAANYLPNVLAALLLVIAGIVGGKIVGNAVTRAATASGMALGSVIGNTVRGTIVLVAIVVAIEQVGIQADLLVVMVAVVVGATLAGAGLAFGLGARSAVSNIVASHYVAQAYRVGQTVRVGGVEGKIIQITPAAVFIATAEGRVLVPASLFSEATSVLVTEAQQS